MLQEKDIIQIQELQKTNPELFNLICRVENHYLEIFSHTCHDLRNSAGLIDGYVQLIEKQLPHLLTNQLWMKLHKNSKSNLRLLDSIGEFRYSHRTDNMEDCSINALLTSITDKYPSLRINMQCTCSSFWGDMYNITSSLLALLKNATETTSETDVITLAIKTDTNFLHFIVTDNGNGFTPDLIPKVFEPFFSEKRGHTGLGLSIAQNTAQRHGGNVIIRNLNAPTIVDFYIPLK